MRRLLARGAGRDRPAPAAGVVSEAFDAELVVYVERTNDMYCLDTWASAVWALCDGRRELEEIVTEVAGLASLGPETVRGDVEAAVAKLRELGLLR